MSTNDSNFKSTNPTDYQIVGITIKNDDKYHFVEMKELQDISFEKLLKTKYNNPEKINKLINEQSSVIYDGSDLVVAPFYDLSEYETKNIDEFNILEGGVRLFKSLKQVFKFSFVDKIYVFENNDWYVSDPFVIRHLINHKKINEVTIDVLKKI